MESPIRRADDRGRDPDRMIDHIRRALESNDLEAFAALYAEDATLEEVSSLNPPSHPHVVKGRDAILRRLRDELVRDPVSGWSRQVANSSVVDQVESDDAVAFTEVRTFAAGDKAVAQHLCHKRNGLITHDRLVVAWDAAA
jgi:hypothetical protein